MERTIEIPKNRSLDRHTELQLSMQFGYIGLGMGGCAIATECASIRTGAKNKFYPYTALLVNTNTQDFERLHYSNKQIQRLQLKGYEKGAGRNIEIGEQAFLTHKDLFVREVERLFSNRDFIWIVCGLGGGTGTGSILQVINTLRQHGYKGKFGLILVLPRSGEGSRVFQNALNRLQKIAKAMKHLGSIILVDNNKLYNEFVEANKNVSFNQYISYSNRYIARVLHELNVITANFSPYGDNHFDSSEFENVIKTPGVLHISRVMVEESQAELGNELSYLNDVKSSIEEGVLSSGYNLRKTSHAAISVLTNKNTADRMYQLTFNQSLEDMLQETVPFAEEKPVSMYVDTQTKHVHFYGVFAGLDLPTRIKELVEETNRLNREAEKLKKDDDDVMGVLASFRETEQQHEENEPDTLFNDEHMSLFEDVEDEKEKATKKEEIDIFL